MTEADKAALGIFDRIWKAYLSYNEHNYPLTVPNLYLGQEEYRCLRLADDYTLRCRWSVSPARQEHYMGMPLFVVNAGHHLNVGGIDG